MTLSPWGSYLATWFVQVVATGNVSVRVSRQSVAPRLVRESGFTAFELYFFAEVFCVAQVWVVEIVVSRRCANVPYVGQTSWNVEPNTWQLEKYCGELEIADW